MQDVSMAGGEAKAVKESSDESNSDSSASNSHFSSEDGSSDVSDLDKFHKEFGGLTAGVDEVDFDRIVAGNTNDDVPGLVLEGGLDTLPTLTNVPKTWPLARLTIPLSGFSKQLERLVESYGGYGNKCATGPTPIINQNVCKGPSPAACIPPGGTNFFTAPSSPGPSQESVI